ncbi:SusC/RagA family TonB-linked outer membrane protein [Echinicola sp. 20G]|uniref:SusC/RagA family TonB-linked outer membrane protein n=1 Tax=Echinicola sp. 20G TaxID=2781961 RepID=UPI001F455E49|nr:SusC/RagA family TonB-linked outer membrane protein [Echinicola sp. 20G]
MKKILPLIVMSIKLLARGCAILCLTVAPLFAKTSNAQIKGIDEVFIELNGEPKTITQFFKEIERHSEFKFFYNHETLKSHSSIQYLRGKGTVEDHLYEVAKQTGLRFRQINNSISVIINNDDHAQLITKKFDFQKISGVVKDEFGDPMPGVSILIKGTTTGTVTGVDGSYSLEAAEGQILQFSFIGYERKEFTVGSATILDVELTPTDSNLEEFVVIGYGTASKRDITGAVSSVKAERLTNENPNSVQDILRGNVAGLIVGMSTSAKGGGSLQIRGRTSLNAGSTPLIVVDGAIFYGDLADINPNDIESLEVLKDASAAAVFGAKAANGVIMIVTKRGKKGKPTINVNSNFGLATIASDQRTYEGTDFLDWRSDVYYSMNAASAEPYEFSDPRTMPSSINIDDWLAYDGSSGDPLDVWLRRIGLQPIEIQNYKEGKTVNWHDRIYQTGFRQDHTMSLSGRNENLSYYWSLGYTNNEGIVIGDEFETLRSRLNIDAKINNFLTVGMNTQFAIEDNSTVPVSTGQYRNLSPYASEYDEDGNLKYNPNDENNGGIHPHYDRQYIDRLNRESTINSTIYASLNLPWGFNFRTNFTPRLSFYEYYNHQSAEHATWGLEGGYASRRQRKTSYWQVDNILTWKKTFNDMHNFNATFLVNAEKYQSWDNTMSNNGFLPHDRLGYHNIGSGVLPVISSNDEYSTGDALMGRLLYNYGDKYSTTLSVRRDGYSAFGQSNPRATFYSAALAWVFTEENFINWNWLDFGKLRLSYGSNGNRDIGRYVALSDLSTNKYFYQNEAGELYPVSQLYVNRMSNPNLKWERTNSVNIGLDFSLFKGVLDGTMELYKMSTKDLLVERTLPDIVGFNWVYDNLGQVDNKGLELTINSTNINRGNFTWRTGFNFQLNRNEIVSLYGDLDEDGNELDDYSNGWFIGQAIDRIWNYETDGVWQLGEEDAAAEYQLEPGDYRLVDVNGDGKFSELDDKQFLGYSEPRYRWSLRNEFKYKNFDLSFMFYSYWGHESSFNLMKNRDSFLDLRNSYVAPYWTEENPNSEWARLSSDDGGIPFSVYRKKSFIRFENISLAYTLPKKMVERAKIENLRFYFNVRNLGYYAPDWNWFDPENSAPTPRYMTLGIDLTF